MKLIFTTQEVQRRRHHRSQHGLIHQDEATVVFQPEVEEDEEYVEDVEEEVMSEQESVEEEEEVIEVKDIGSRGAVVLEFKVREEEEVSPEEVVSSIVIYE